MSLKTIIINLPPIMDFLMGLVLTLLMLILILLSFLASYECYKVWGIHIVTLIPFTMGIMSILFGMFILMMFFS